MARSLLIITLLIVFLEIATRILVLWLRGGFQWLITPKDEAPRLDH